MGLLKGYPDGSDITLMNTIYLYPTKNPETNKWDKGSITLICKDNNTGRKFYETKDNPDYEFYVTKPDVVLEHNELFIDKDKVDKMVVPYNDLEKEIAVLTNNTEFYYNNIKNGNRYANKMLHMHPSVFMSDTHIEDHYRFRFSNHYSNNICNISKAYFDIEADTINMRGDFPEMGECPINAVTVIDEANNQVYTFLLRNDRNPLIKDFENSVSKNLFAELKEFIRDTVGGWKNEHRLGLKDLNFNLLFYDEDDEINLIRDMFLLINTSQPDFVLAWNMSFDIPYTIERIRKLGYNPEDIICHPDFKRKVAKYYIDERNKNDLAERGDYAIISSYSVYLDQMIHFASRRKGQAQFTSFSLDAIGGLVAKVHKLDYSHITTNIAELPYRDYKTFVFYNIMDTIVQKCIESKTGDINYIFSKCINNNTRYQKGHRQTVYLANRGCSEFLKEGFIIGNNVNKRNPAPETKFPGAFVGDPARVSDYSKLKMHGVPIDVFDNLDDFDYTALYPSVLREFNMAPNTQIGMVVIPEAINDKENKFNSEKYTRSGAFIEDLQSGVYLEFCNRWLNMGNYLELYKDIIEYFHNIRIPFDQLKWCTPQGLIIPADVYNKDLNIRPVIFADGLIKPTITYKVPNMNGLEVCKKYEFDNK